MSNAMPLVGSRLKLVEPMQIMITGEKFLKWCEPTSNSDKMFPVGVTLRTDEKGYILYWREINQKLSYIDLSMVRDVRTGPTAAKPQDEKLAILLSSGKSNVPIEDKTITIVYGTDHVNVQTVNFVAMTEYPLEVTQKWTNFIFNAATNQRMLNLSPLDCIEKLRVCLLYGRGTYDEKKQRYGIAVQTLISFFASASNQFNIRYERDKFIIMNALKNAGLPHKKNDIIESSEFTIKSFTDMFINLIDDDSFEKVFSTAKKNALQPDQFAKLINEEQRYPGLNEQLFPLCQTEQAKHLINKFELDESHKNKHTLSAVGLIHYLMDFENSIIDPLKYDQYDDMDHPLTDYFINSSHNTYLTGHQITGRSDADIYRHVLLSGCRCIELDCHEDETKTEPVITHGRTLCTKIQFVDAIRAINDTAFKTSPYPVILSFENYCGTKLRQKMVRYMLQYFGEKLLIEPLEEHPGFLDVKQKLLLLPGIQLPSPEQLKYKILVKFSVKIPKKAEKVTEDMMMIPESDGSDDEGSVCDTESSPGGSEKKRSSSSRQNSTITISDMKNLVNYVTPLKFHSFEINKDTSQAYNVTSFSESVAAKLIMENPFEFVRLTQRQFVRIYPKGTRISSDNFLPHTYWMAGCQMVALNFQTLDIGMQLNNGKFDVNNRTGYLLKPAKLRSTFQANSNSFNLLTKKPIDGVVCLKMNIKVLSGIFLDLNEKRHVETVSVDVYGLPNDTVIGSKAHRTVQATHKCFNVTFSHSGLNLPRVIYPELAQLKLAAYDSSNRPIASRVLPMDCLRAGYRYVCLKNPLGQPTLMSILLLHITIQDYYDDDWDDLVQQMTGISQNDND